MAKERPEVLEELVQHYEMYYQETGQFDVGLVVEMAEKASSDLLGNFVCAFNHIDSVRTGGLTLCFRKASRPAFDNTCQAANSR